MGGGGCVCACACVGGVEGWTEKAREVEVDVDVLEVQLLHKFFYTSLRHNAPFEHPTNFPPTLY